MPKEVIHRRTPEPGFEVEVGWSQDREVQVGVVGSDGRSLNWLLHAPGVYGLDGADDNVVRNSHLAKIGETLARQLVELHPKLVTRCAAAVGSGDTDEARGDLATFGVLILNSLDVQGNYRGVFADLGREGCNDLIRILRRARDSAYGRDE